MQLISTNQVAAFKPHRPYFPNLIGQTQLRPLLAVGGDTSKYSPCLDGFPCVLLGTLSSLSL
jgi:hypothetical protein